MAYPNQVNGNRNRLTPPHESLAKKLIPAPHPPASRSPLQEKGTLPDYPLSLLGSQVKTSEKSPSHSSSFSGPVAGWHQRRARPIMALLTSSFWGDPDSTWRGEGPEGEGREVATAKAEHYQGARLPFLSPVPSHRPCPPHLLFQLCVGRGQPQPLCISRQKRPGLHLGGSEYQTSVGEERGSQRR